MSVKRLAIVAGTLGQGGAERQLTYILKALRGLGIEATVYALTSGEFYEQAVLDNGARLIHVTSTGRAGRFLEISRLVKHQEPDAVMSMHFFTNLYAYAAAQYSAVPSIGALRNDCYSEMRDLGRFGSASLTAPSIIVANSQAATESAIEAGRSRRKVFYLGNVVDADRFKPKGDRKPNPRPKLLYLGRLEKQKRIDRLLRLVSRLSAQIDVDCSIYGAGSLEQELKSAADALDFGDSAVRFEGLASDVVPLYHQADLLLMTSDHEGTPNVVLEAQASGLPVVATAAGGTADIIENGRTGVVVPIQDENALYTETLKLLQRPEIAIRYAQNARTFIERNHSLDSLGQALTGILHAAINE